jgi:putative nucleotidyltransferase with HDIG domain
MKSRSRVSNILNIILATILLMVISSVVDMNPLGVVFLIITFVYLHSQHKEFEKKGYNLLYLIFLVVIFFAVSDTIIKRQLPFYFIPFSLIPMLATILFSDLPISLWLSLILSMILALLSKGNIYLAIMVLNSSILSSLLVYGIRRRSQIIRAGILVGIIQAIGLFFMENFMVNEPIPYLAIFVNGWICGIIVVGLLPIFEYLFKTITNISLLEMSDLNHPLLKDMILNAPGTYHHSLVVGHLSEAACEAVGANALLSRIGAYYHDIGKIDKAEYFVENQAPDLTKHDNLAPSMSRLVIINHVKEGVELAKKHKLNPRIADFILQHHGNSLVYYFYRRALESQNKDNEVKEDVFRYPGPKANTKETAIVMLADSVEAASRTLKEPTPAKIEELVHKVINNKFIDGQLDECNLTLKDLERIARVFIRILTHIYHARVAYPEGKEGANSHKKPTKQQNSPRTQEDKERSS